MSEAQRSWVERVLGLTMSTQVDVPTLTTWQDARDITNSQISKLQDQLRGTNHPLFVKIADRGLNGFSGRYLVGIQTALMDLDRAGGATRAQAVAKARKAIGDVRAFLQTHPVVPLLEKNPFKTPVLLRAVLIPALDRIERSFGA